MEIKPIETIYNGYRFRSRLEARWAVFFDAMGIEYQYEIEGFDCGDGVYYLPDFYLPNEKCYVEVKGTDEALQEDKHKIGFAVDYNATPCSDGLLILGDIPNPTQIAWGNIPLFSLLYNHKAVVHEYATFLPSTSVWHPEKLVRGSQEIIKRIYTIPEFDNADAYDDGIPKKTSTKCKWVKEVLESYYFNDPKNSMYILTQAYTKARQVRFEHGETPILNNRRN